MEAVPRINVPLENSQITPMIPVSGETHTFFDILRFLYNWTLPSTSAERI